MRNLEDIEKDLTAAREALTSVTGTPAEVYSRIVGYYRSVRNWNLGKREEYGERRLFRIVDQHHGEMPAAAPSPFSPPDVRLLLFTRSACPQCPPAKAAAEGLGIPVDLVNTDTAEGMVRAAKYKVMATPTAILLSSEGKELSRAWNAASIAALVKLEPVAV
ncbi:MAG: hypothetical protein FWH12_09745 [Treponema sp.]|nr:hypothetical protein [Treponema sp.]